MRHVWFDITAGVSGDMLLGSLIDAGAPLDDVQAAVEAVVPGAVRLERRQVTRAGQRATKVDVVVLVDDPPHRSWRDVELMLSQSGLAASTMAGALATFNALAVAEGRAHGCPPDEVHFHEVGALDSVADIVGVHEALRLLGVATCSASPVAVGAGRVAVAHGDMPVPVPAVAELAIGWKIVPVHDRSHADLPARRHAHNGGHSHGHDTPAEVLSPGSPGELATPTGLAVIRTLTTTCTSLPAMQVEGVGVGAGGRDTPDRPNTVRALLGEVDDETSPPMKDIEQAFELMANIDDMDPRLWPGAIDAMLAAGAFDAWLVPIHMKKGRPAFTVHALVSGSTRAEVLQVLLRHTSTLGVRQVSCERTRLDRSWRHLSVDGETVEVKVASLNGRVLHAAAEFSSISRIAQVTRSSESAVAQRAAAAIVAAGLMPGQTLQDAAGSPQL